jgi:hypothetical protein
MSTEMKRLGPETMYFLVQKLKWTTLNGTILAMSKTIHHPHNQKTQKEIQTQPSIKKLLLKAGEERGKNS